MSELQQPQLTRLLCQSNSTLQMRLLMNMQPRPCLEVCLALLQCLESYLGDASVSLNKAKQVLPPACASLNG